MKRALVYGSFLAATLLYADDLVNLDEITVTAERVEEASLKQALSIAKKDTEEIELDQVVFQKDLLNSLSNVLVTQTTSGIGHMMSVRTPITTQPYFLYLQDGIPVQSSGFFNHNALAYTTYESASEAEVLKGAGTALYGSDAVAAVVNIASLTPDGEERTRVKLQGGSYGYKRAFTSHTGSLSESTDMAITASYTDNDGYRDHSSYERGEFNAKFVTVLDDKNVIETAFNYSKTDAEQTGWLTKEELYDDPKSVGNIASVLDTIDPKRKFDFARASIRWDSEISQVLSMSTIGYIRYTRNRYTATWEPNLPQNDSKQTTLGVMHKTTQQVSWGRNVYGLDVEYTQGSQEYIQAFDFVPSSWGSSVDEGLIYDYDVDYVAIAPYIQTDVVLSDTLTLELGARYDYNRFDYTNNTDTGQYGESSYYRPADRTDSFNHFSPKASLAYRPDKDTEWYIRYANGFRIPSATRLYSQKTGTSVDGLDPETSDTFELGYKHRFTKAYVEVVAYYMTIDDTIVRREDENKNRYYENGGKSIHKGIELTYKQKYSDMFAFSFAGSYAKSNFDDDPIYGDNEMAAAPDYKINARAYFTPNSATVLMAEAQYVGSYYMDDANTRTYGGYAVFNLKGSYRYNKHWKGFAKIDNVTDKVYAQKADYAYGSERYTPGLPRMFYAGIEYTF